MKMTSKLLICSLVLAIFSVGSGAYAESLNFVKQFSSFNGTVEFLPGAWVSVWEDGKDTYYKFDNNKYIKTDKLPKLLNGWESFDWSDEDIDSANQIALSTYDSDLNSFIPSNSKIKKIIEIPRANNQRGELVFVCFTSSSKDKFSLPSATDIYVYGFVKTMKGNAPIYRVIWERKLISNASYARMDIQNNGNKKKFLVLYWAQVAGSGSVSGLNLYTISN